MAQKGCRVSETRVCEGRSSSTPPSRLVGSSASSLACVARRRGALLAASFRFRSPSCLAPVALPARPPVWPAHTHTPRLGAAEACKQAIECGRVRVTRSTQPPFPQCSRARLVRPPPRLPPFLLGLLIVLFRTFVASSSSSSALESCRPLSSHFSNRIERLATRNTTAASAGVTSASQSKSLRPPQPHSPPTVFRVSRPPQWSTKVSRGIEIGHGALLPPYRGRAARTRSVIEIPTIAPPTTNPTERQTTTTGDADITKTTGLFALLRALPRTGQLSPHQCHTLGLRTIGPTLDFPHPPTTTNAPRGAAAVAGAGNPHTMTKREAACKHRPLGTSLQESMATEMATVAARATTLVHPPLE